MNQDTTKNTRADLIKRFWWTPLVGIPLAVLLMFGLRNFVRETLALPLSYIFWLVGILAQTIPQLWLWIGLVVIALIIALRSLDRERRPPPPTPGKSAYLARGRIDVWAERIDMLVKGKYSRQRFGYFIGKLIMEVLSHEERVNFRDIERRLAQGEVEAPPVVHDYLSSRLRSGLNEPRPGLLARLKSFLKLEKPQTAQLNAEVETIVKFLENQMEV
ncbi:MAG: hypothetical protein WHX52_22580 [Anaerolineae bacterium]